MDKDYVKGCGKRLRRPVGARCGVLNKSGFRRLCSECVKKYPNG